MDIGQIFNAADLQVSRKGTSLVAYDETYDEHGFSNGSDVGFISTDPKREASELLESAKDSELTFVVKSSIEGSEGLFKMEVA